MLRVTIYTALILTGKKSSEVIKWARSRGLQVEKRVHRGPQILWLEARRRLPGLENRLYILIAVPKPEPEEFGPGVALQVPQRNFSIKRPVAEGYSVDSSIELEVGDILVLEGGEQLCTKDSGICMIAIVHLTNPLVETLGRGDGLEQASS